MRLLKRKAGTEPGAGPGLLQVADDFPGGNDELFAEIERLTEDNRASRDRETERRLLRLRHIAGIRLLDADGRRPEHPAPEFGKLPDSQGLPNIAREDLTPGLLRAGILRDGCLLVRGLVDRAEAARFAGQIDRSFTERDRHDEGQTAAEGY